MTTKDKKIQKISENNDELNDICDECKKKRWECDTEPDTYRF